MESLKTESWHNANIFVIGGTVSGHKDSDASTDDNVHIMIYVGFQKNIAWSIGRKTIYVLKIISLDFFRSPFIMNIPGFHIHTTVWSHTEICTVEP